MRSLLRLAWAAGAGSLVLAAQYPLGKCARDIGPGDNQHDLIPRANLCHGVEKAGGERPRSHSSSLKPKYLVKPTRSWRFAAEKKPEELRGSDRAQLVPRGGEARLHDHDGATRAAYRAAALRTSLLLLCACAFGLGTMITKGRQAGLEFFAGYLVEQSLSVDNLFIFIMLFEYFKVPAEFQSRVLNWGIIGAVSMRAVMIVVGVAAIQRFRWVMLLFAGVLVVSSANLLLEKDSEGDSAHLEGNTVLKVAKWLCNSTDFYDGEKFFTMVNGVKRATPLLLCLVCIELTDFVFAVDSIPAVLGISTDTFIVYTSNVFAIMAMRSLYVLVSHAISDLPYLKPAVALVLGFVGAKMFAEFFHYEVGIGMSLGVVSGILSVGAIASVISNRRRDSRLANSRAESLPVSAGGNEAMTFKPVAAGGGTGMGLAATPIAAEAEGAVEVDTACASVAMSAEMVEAGENGAEVDVVVDTVVENTHVREEYATFRFRDEGGDGTQSESNFRYGAGNAPVGAQPECVASSRGDPVIKPRDDEMEAIIRQDSTKYEEAIMEESNQQNLGSQASRQRVDEAAERAGVGTDEQGEARDGRIPPSVHLPPPPPLAEDVTEGDVDEER